MAEHAPAATGISRRTLLNRIAWALVSASGAVGLGAAVRLLFPRVRFTPPTTVVLGRPEEFALGVIERWKKSHRIVLVREERGFYALLSTCTHLGCVPSWQATQRKFKCPCHGSGFHVDGVNFEGPAPRPLERLAIRLDDEGQLVVDTAVRLRRERGEWERPEGFLAMAAPGRPDGKA